MKIDLSGSGYSFNPIETEEVAPKQENKVFVISPQAISEYKTAKKIFQIYQKFNSDENRTAEEKVNKKKSLIEIHELPETYFEVEGIQAFEYFQSMMALERLFFIFQDKELMKTQRIVIRRLKANGYANNRFDMHITDANGLYRVYASELMKKGVDKAKEILQSFMSMGDGESEIPSLYFFCDDNEGVRHKYTLQVVDRNQKRNEKKQVGKKRKPQPTKIEAPKTVQVASPKNDEDLVDELLSI